MATVNDLIELLQYKIEHEGMDPDAELVGVFQPSYPLSTDSITILDGSFDQDGEKVEDNNVVYIGLGEGYNYGSSRVYNEGEEV